MHHSMYLLAAEAARLYSSTKMVPALPCSSTHSTCDSTSCFGPCKKVGNESEGAIV